MDEATPVQVLLDFNTKYIDVVLKDVPQDSADHSAETPVKPNVFDVLLNAQKSYTHLPVAREERNSKDRLYNCVLQFLKKHDVGFTPMQVETTGKYIVQTLVDTLWYLDPHWDKFSSRSITCPEFEEFRRFNNWKKMKIKEPQLTNDGLHDTVSKVITMLSIGYFNKKFAKFKGMLDGLVNTMVKYSELLEKQTKRSASNRKQESPIRSLNDNNVIRGVPAGVDEKKYTLVDQSLRLLKDYEPLFLIEYEPEDKYERMKWLNGLVFEYPVTIYTHRFGNYMGNFSFVWKSPDSESKAEGNLNAVTAVKHDLPKFSTRAMRKSFFLKYAASGTKPAVLRHMYRFLTSDNSAAESENEAEVDERLTDFLLHSDSTEILYDLRKNNGRPKDPELDPFWDALGKYLERIAVVHERRHGDHMYMPIDMSIESLIETVKQDLPKDAKVPSASWVAFNFWPANAYFRSAMSYTGKFDVKYAVQQRLTRAHHPDSFFAYTQFVMMKEMAVDIRDESLFICLDDKSVVPIGEPGKPVSTNVRAHNKSLTLAGAKLSALDHDFHIHGAIPSVMFTVDIPENHLDSFYKGSIDVTVKVKVFTPSSPMRHIAESLKIVRNEHSGDGLSSDKPIVFVYTDGGPDHRCTYWSVQLSYICMFVALDLDMLIAARTAPPHSYNNPAERCMSLLNIALQNVALDRAPMLDNLECRVKSATSISKLRDVSTKNPDLKGALAASLEPVLSVLKQRFSKLKLHGDNIRVHDAATEEEIPQTQECLQIFSDDEEKPLACKSLQQSSARLKWFVETHCRRRTYTFQIRKCDGVEEDCWFCSLFPKRTDTKLEWLPDPTKGPVGDYLPLKDCIGKATNDDARPSLNGKVVATEADKKNKAYLNAAQVRHYITCTECQKRRVVFCRHKLSAAELAAVRRVEDGHSYTCGSPLFPQEHNLFAEVFVREALTCASEIETAYYSAVTRNFPAICFYCGDTDVLGNEEEPMLSLLKEYSIVRPICRGCHESDKAPETRNAMKL